MLPASVTSEPRLNYFVLIDMTKRTRTQCYPAVKFCRVMTVRPGTHAPVLPAGPVGTNEYLERTDLGHAQRAGQDTTGTRETLTLRADAEGNNRPMISKKEIWYSPYLQVNVSVTRQSPKSGTDVLTLGDISLGEPAAALLAVPEGYKVVDEQLAPDMANKPVAGAATR